MSEVNIEKWVTLKEVQAYLGVGRETVLTWIAKRMIGFVLAAQPMIGLTIKPKGKVTESVFGDN